MCYRLEALGSLTLSRDQVPVRGAASGRVPLALLAILARAGPSGERRDRITALLWPESDAERARNSLRQTLHLLRTALGRDVVLGSDELRLASNLVASDVAEFLSAVERDDLHTALRLYSGPFLDGFFLRGSRTFEEWVDRERTALSAKHNRVLEQAAEQATQAGDLGAAVEFWRRRVAEERLSSRVTVRLMHALAAAGDRPAGIQTGLVHQQLVLHELGCGADPEVVELTQTLARETEQAGPPLAPGKAATATRPAIVGGGAAEHVGAEQVNAAEHVGADPGAEGRPGRTRPLWRLLDRRPRLITAGMVALAMVTLLWLRTSTNSTAMALEPRAGASVVVFPFRAYGDEASSFLGTAAVELLTNAIDGSEGLRGTDPLAVHALVRREGTPEVPAHAARLAKRLGGELYVLGTVIARGGELRVSAALYDSRAPETPLASASADGTVLDPFTPMDQLAARLLAARSPPGTRVLTHTAALTTNLAALKSFLSAEQALRDYDLQRAVAGYTLAIDHDSAFALAYFRLAQAARYNGVTLRADTLLDRAHHFATRLPTRYRRALDAVTASLNADPRADALLREHVQQYPGDAHAWFELGDWLLHHNPPRGQPLMDAEQALDRAVALDSTNRYALTHLFELKLLGGERRAAGRVVQRLPAVNPRHTTWRIVTALDGRGPATLDTAMRLLAAVDFETRRASLLQLATLTDRAREAERLWRCCLYPPTGGAVRPPRRRPLIWLSLLQGRIRDAWTEIDLHEQETGELLTIERAWLAALPWTPVDTATIEGARSLYQQLDLAAEVPDWTSSQLQVAARSRAFILALISHRLGDSNAVARHIDELGDARGDSAAATLGRELKGVLEAWLAIQRGDHGAARDHFAGSVIGPIREGSRDAHYLARYLTAQTAEALGEYYHAARWYRSLYEDYTTFRTILFRAPALLGEARALEQLGRGDDARVRYRRVERLWEHADPSLRDVVDNSPRGGAALDAARSRQFVILICTGAGSPPGSAASKCALPGFSAMARVQSRRT